MLTDVDLGFGSARLFSRRGRTAQNGLQHHGARIGGVEHGPRATRAQAIRAARSNEFDACVWFSGCEQVLLELRLESGGRRGPFGAVALLGSTVRDHGHRNRSGCKAHDRRCTLAHGQRVPIDFHHNLGPNLARKISQSSPEQRESH
jgi:hypothetical protein